MISAAEALALSAEAWLMQLNQAEQTKSYSGAFVYERAGYFSTHQLWHTSSSETVKERYLRLDGPAMELVTLDGQVHCASDDFILQFPVVPSWKLASLDMSHIRQGYDLNMAGHSRVAGRDAIVLLLRPQDPHRFGVELHLDSASALPLKILTVDESGDLLDRVQFTTFSLGKPSPRNMQASSTCIPQLKDSATSSAVLPVPWHSEWMPKGFRLMEYGRQDEGFSVTGSPISWLTYGDGLVHFSIFLELTRGQLVADQRSQVGSTTAVSKRISTAAGEVMVTVVGDIPLGTAERIALSMRADKGVVLD